MGKLKDQLQYFWWGFKQDPWGYIFYWILILLIIAGVAFIILLIYLACTGQIKDTGDSSSHGIYMIPMYNGNNVTFLPMPY